MSRSHSDFINELLRSLRSEIMAAYGQVDHDVKEDLSVVTEIDKKVEQKIIDALNSELPDHGILGEEHGQQGSTDTYWVIDPIDGTESYVRGLPGATSMMALVEDGVAVQSYIYDPVDDIMYSAFKGGGAYADDEQIKVLNRPIDRSIVATSTGLGRFSPEVLKDIYDTGVFYVSQYFGSGLKAVYMATGKIDGIIAYNKPGGGGGPWDFIPTQLLIEEAGAKITKYDDNPLFSRFFTATSGNLFEPINKVVKEKLIL